MLDAYRAWYEVNRAARSLVEFDRARGLLGPAVEKMPLAEFGRGQAVDYLDRLNAAGLAPATVGMRVALVSGAWRWAARRGEVASSPWRDLPLPGKEEPERPSWTPAEFARLAGAAPPWLRDVLTVGVLSGLRVGELIALPWSWVERAGGKAVAIRVPAEASKSGRNRRVPAHPALTAWLDARLARDGDDGGPILRGRAGRPITTTGRVNKAIASACDKAGLPRASSHAMRRSFGRWIVQGLGPWEGRPGTVYYVSEAYGHADIRVTQDYLDLDASSADDWMSGARGDWSPEAD
jgi:integrase